MSGFWRGSIFALSCLFSLAALPSSSSAADYPTRPVRWMIGFSAGGPVDTVARIMSQWLSDHFGQQFVVENRTGSGGNIAAAAGISAPPDGYTLIFAATNNAISASLYKKLPYDFIRDTEPVASIMQLPNMMVVANDMPVKSVKEFIDYCKANPGKISYASSGNGTSVHMSAELFKALTKCDMLHVPYRGSAAAIPDVISNKVQLIFDGAGAGARRHVARVRGHLAATLAERPGYSGDRGDRSGIRVGRLLRHLRAEGDAAGNHRKAQQGRRRSAEGPQTGGAAGRDRRGPQADDPDRIRQAGRRRDREMAQGRGVCRGFGGLSGRHCRNAAVPVNGPRTVRVPSPRRPPAAGPVAQWLEPAAHNGLVAGSSPAGPTNDYGSLPRFWRLMI
jgi:tripartite-type tricarboxylate transporter receptor subunit TctC